MNGVYVLHDRQCVMDPCFETVFKLATEYNEAERDGLNHLCRLSLATLDHSPVR